MSASAFLFLIKIEQNHGYVTSCSIVMYIYKQQALIYFYLEVFDVVDLYCWFLKAHAEKPLSSPPPPPLSLPTRKVNKLSDLLRSLKSFFWRHWHHFMDFFRGGGEQNKVGLGQVVLKNLEQILGWKRWAGACFMYNFTYCSGLIFLNNTKLISKLLW